MPSRAETEADIADFYKQLEAKNVPVRYAHNQSDMMPVNQWQYNNRLVDMCGPDVGPLEDWRLRIHSCQSKAIFTRPETFRDEWTSEEAEAFKAAEAACRVRLTEYQSTKVS